MRFGRLRENIASTAEPNLLRNLRSLEKNNGISPSSKSAFHISGSFEPRYFWRCKLHHFIPSESAETARADYFFCYEAFSVERGRTTQRQQREPRCGSHHSIALF